MEIQSYSNYTGLTSISNASRQRQECAGSWAEETVFAASPADNVTISQAAQQRLAAETQDDSGYDFTHIAPNDVLNSINGLIKSGKMSVDESSALMASVPLTELNAAMGKTGAANKPINLYSSLEKLIAFNKSIHNDSGAIYAQKAFSALERLQRR